MYKVKQVLWEWYEKIDKYLRSRDFNRSSSNSNVYIREKRDDIIIMVVYFDDLIITGNNNELIPEEK